MKKKTVLHNIRARNFEKMKNLPITVSDLDLNPGTTAFVILLAIYSSSFIEIILCFDPCCCRYIVADM